MQDEDMTFDDEILMAYTDGVATPGQAGAIEAAMESDETVRRKVLAFLRSTHRLRAAYQPIAEEAVPEHLVAAVRAAAGRRGLVQLPPRQAPSRTFWRMAAGFVLAAVIGAGVGGWGSSALDGTRQVADADGFRGVYQAAVDRALEGLPNGRTLKVMFANGTDADLKPVSTYLNDVGEFCREFEARFVQPQGARTVISVACRQNVGSWRIDGAFLGAEPAQDVFKVGFTR
jgi:anti-sigma factor RsiW